ncbi:GNAT family N-acetyltransferase [Kordia jejudonensis]|uniref:GNAT family N-acetyltransferase n=1 Tax=Kordia jejudonensis TaxID=1348245 RepID=UPI0006290B84|nr:GNAT family N-acetyltransferase [Kordia jejudonensis]
MTTLITNNADCFNDLAQLFDAYRVFYRKTSDLSGAKAFLEERIKNKESVIYVSCDQNKTVTGFVQLYPLFSSTQMKRMWLLNDLFVATAQRGKGFSKELINAAKNHCKTSGYCGLMLETEKNNTVANKLYEVTNFELDTLHNFYYWDVTSNA